MAESAKGKPRALVIGTRHELQRHQDSMPEREELRAEFEDHLREVIEERKVSFIAEEAGDDTEVDFWYDYQQHRIFSGTQSLELLQ